MFKSIGRNGEDSLTIYLREIGKFPLLTPQEENRLARRIKRGDGQALEILTSSNLRCVVRIAKTFCREGISLSDLINEGNIGLMRAAKKFDPERGVRFISYASWWIRQAIQRALAQSGAVVRLPVNKVEEVRRVTWKSATLAQEFKRQPTIEEIARELGVGSDRVSYAVTLASRHLSLDHAYGEDETRSLSDFVEADVHSPEEQAFGELERETIREAVQALSAREAEVITLYFGLGSGRCCTLEQIGERLGISRERVRQLKVRALSKLRDALPRTEWFTATETKGLRS